MRSTAGNIYIENASTSGITFGAGGTLQVLASGKTIGLQTDAVHNLGTTGATGVVSTNSGTVELAPNATLAVVSLGTGGDLAISTLDGVIAERVRIGAVTLPGHSTPTIQAGSIAIVGAGFNATSVHVLELDRGQRCRAGGATFSNRTDRVRRQLHPDKRAEQHRHDRPRFGRHAWFDGIRRVDHCR